MEDAILPNPPLINPSPPDENVLQLRKRLRALSNVVSPNDEGKKNKQTKEMLRSKKLENRDTRKGAMPPTRAAVIRDRIKTFYQGKMTRHSRLREESERLIYPSR